MRSQWSGALELQSVAGTAGRFYLGLGGGAEAMCPHGQFLADLAASEDLDGVRALCQALFLQRLRRHLGIGVEALLEIAEIDRLRFRPEVLERHRLLFVRAAQLSHSHMNGVLPPLVAGLPFGARP